MTTTVQRNDDPDATQAIGLHRAGEPPTPRRTARGGHRGFAAVLPWNWFRRGDHQ